METLGSVMTFVLVQAGLQTLGGKKYVWRFGSSSQRAVHAPAEGLL